MRTKRRGFKLKPDITAFRSATNKTSNSKSYAVLSIALLPLVLFALLIARFLPKGQRKQLFQRLRRIQFQEEGDRYTQNGKLRAEGGSHFDVALHKDDSSFIACKCPDVLLTES